MGPADHQDRMLALLTEIRDQQREALAVQREQAELAREQLERSRRAVEESIKLQRQALEKQKGVRRIALPGAGDRLVRRADRVADLSVLVSGWRWIGAHEAGASPAGYEAELPNQEE